jgi:hypothetical protein
LDLVLLFQVLYITFFLRNLLWQLFLFLFCRFNSGPKVFSLLSVFLGEGVDDIQFGCCPFVKESHARVHFANKRICSSNEIHFNTSIKIGEMRIE